MNLAPPSSPRAGAGPSPSPSSPAPSVNPAAPRWSPPATLPPPTVRAVLFESDDPPLAVATGDSAGDALDRLPPPLRAAARKEAKRAVLGALDIALPDIVLRGWLRHSALKAAAERTRDGGRELVELADHTVASVHRPRITLTLDGAPLTVLAITIEISLKIIGLTAVVEQAALVGLESGAVVATATLKLGAEVAATRTQRLDAHQVILLDRPRPLLAAQPTPPRPPAGSS